jgi:ribonucleoside-diphosphate reductase alpha chain
MPYEEIDREEYEKLVAKFPKIDFSKLWRYEEEDYTKAAQELACVAGACEIEYVPTGLENGNVQVVEASQTATT